MEGTVHESPLFSCGAEFLLVVNRIVHARELELQGGCLLSYGEYPVFIREEAAAQDFRVHDGLSFTQSLVGGPEDLSGVRRHEGQKTRPKTRRGT